MSLGKLINNKLSDKLSVVKYIDKELGIRPYFSLKKVRGNAKKLHEFMQKSYEEGDTDPDQLNKMFFNLWFSFFADHKRSKGTIHPSQLRGSCERMQVYELLHTPEDEGYVRDVAPRTQRIFDIGTFVHLYLQTLLYNAGVLIQSEASVNDPDTKVNGKADGILLIDAIKMLLEIKTITQAMWGLVKNMPLPKHIFQATIYAKELGIDKICFLYVNKDTLEIKEHIIDVRENDKRVIDEKVAFLNHSADNNELPDRICCDAKDPNGKWCPYKEVCFARPKRKPTRTKLKTRKPTKRRRK